MPDTACPSSTKSGENSSGRTATRKRNGDSAQFCITAHARVAQIRAQSRESQRQFEEEMRRLREHDERLKELLGREIGE